MKRLVTVGIQASFLATICLFFTWQYYVHVNLAPQVNTYGEPIGYQSVATTSTSSTDAAGPIPIPSIPTSTPASSVLPHGAGVHDGHLDAIEYTSTSVGDSSTTSSTSYTSSAVQSTRTLSRKPFSTSLQDGDETLLPAAPKYIKAIMDPTDTSFPTRLDCPAPTNGRYDYLKPPSTSPSSSSPKIKYFFALDLFECVELLPRLLGTVVETMRFLGPENCALSIVEGRSKDGTFEVLKLLKEEVENIGAKYFFSTNGINPKGGDGIDRVQALADLRNQALDPIFSSPQDFYEDSTVVFINDISLCMDHILELVHQRLIQGADMTCAMDWIFGGSTFYDVWVSRGMNGELFFEVPQSGTWDYANNLFWNDPPVKARLEAAKPFQVFACWNGVTAFTAKPLMEQKIQFRTAYKNECYAGEPTLLCKDMWYEGYGKIAVVPSVNVGYNDDETRKVQRIRGSPSSWTAREGASDLPMLIQWEKNPPATIKCLPSYTTPSWVQWDEGLKEKEPR